MQWQAFAVILSIIGIVYASVIAFTQKDGKRLVAYSSIAHVGLISAGIFVFTTQGLQGAMIQMLSHGINVVGLFFVWDIISTRLKTRDTTQLGGIAKVAPQFAIAFLIIVLGTVALPGKHLAVCNCRFNHDIRRGLHAAHVQKSYAGRNQCLNSFICRYQRFRKINTRYHLRFSNSYRCLSAANSSYFRSGS